MKVCIFTDTYFPSVNGVVTSIETLRQELIRNGHTPYIVTVNSSKIKTTITDNIIRIPAIEVKKFDGHKIGTILNTKVLRQLREWDVDIIHTHTEFTLGTIGRLYAKSKRIPLVHTYHTLYEDYMHYITYGFLNKQMRMIARFLTKHICNYSKEVIVPSEKIYRLLKDYKVDSNIYVIPTGVDLSKFYRSNFSELEISEKKNSIGVSNDEMMITYIGRLAKEKDIDCIVQAFHNVNNELDKCKLVIVGDGPEKKKLEELCEELNIENKVIFLGRVPWEDIGLYYNISDVFVSASRSETQGLTIIEALSSSTPVVCVEDESFSIVKDGYNGLKFNNVDELSNILLRLYNDREILYNLSNNALESITELTTEKFGENIIQIYEKIIKSYDSNKKGKYFRRKKRSGAKKNEK